jgi:uracil phosphoribosyltransferase
MMATGGNAIAAVNILKNNHASKIKMICIIAAPEGIAEMQRVHEDVDIYVACIDNRLNENGYIVPGLGDAGDRLFGTK